MRSAGIEVDAARPDPLYKQIFDQIVERIRSRAFPSGHRLPPSRTLAEELGTTRNTVVRAYMDLEAAGFVGSTVGRGTFVLEQPVAKAPAAPAAAPGGAPWTSL